VVVEVVVMVAGAGWMKVVLVGQMVLNAGMLGSTGE
jgi:hypothetical protein